MTFWGGEACLTVSTFEKKKKKTKHEKQTSHLCRCLRKMGGGVA